MTKVAKIQQRLRSIETAHQRLEMKIEAALKAPAPDDFLLQTLKKQKLALKDLAHDIHRKIQLTHQLRPDRLAAT